MTVPSATSVDSATRTPPLTIGADGRIRLDPHAETLYRDITTKWELSAAAEAQLRVVAEQLTIAAACDRVVARESLVVRDGKGNAKPHPLLALGANVRAASSLSLQRLQLNLS